MTTVLLVKLHDMPSRYGELDCPFFQKCATGLAPTHVSLYKGESVAQAQCAQRGTSILLADLFQRCVASTLQAL